MQSPSIPAVARVLSAAVLALSLLSPAHAQRRALFEEEAKTEWKERDLALPAYPSDVDLIPVDVGQRGNVSFLIDGKSLSLAEDGVVRFTLVARSTGGAENVTYEGIRCETAERKLYAIGRKPAEWVPSRNADWRQIEEVTINRIHAALAKEYFCPPGSVRPGLGQIIDALRRDARIR